MKKSLRTEEFLKELPSAAHQNAPSPTARSIEPNEPSIQASQELQHLRYLPENWDGYGGTAVRSESLRAANRFLATLTCCESFPAPYLSPTRTGGVLIEWENGSKQIEVEIDGLEKGSFVYFNTETHDSVSGELTDAGFKQLANLFQFVSDQESLEGT